MFYFSPLATLINVKISLALPAWVGGSSHHQKSYDTHTDPVTNLVKCLFDEEEIKYLIINIVRVEKATT